QGVAGVDGAGAGPRPVAIRDQRRASPAHANVVERRAQVLGADLGEDRLVPLARARYTDEHLGAAVLVDLHGGPLAGPHAPACLEVARDAEADAMPLCAQIGLTLAPAGVVEQIERAPEFERIVPAVVAHGHAVALDDPGL